MHYPSWLKVKVPSLVHVQEMEALLRKSELNTICEKAKCPNLWECFSLKTATFLILGNICTRNCKFCAVEPGYPEKINADEPEKIVKALEELGLDYIVITSVTRDGLSDGGARHFARCIKAVKDKLSTVCLEVLVPDFLGNDQSLMTIFSAEPTVLNHNVETVRRLYEVVRPEADYERSNGLLTRVKEIEPAILTKSGLMLGLGETYDEILSTMQDIRAANTDFLTLGQYLPPTVHHYPLARYLKPEEFEYFEQVGLEMGFRGVASGPLVRSSYRAKSFLLK